MLDLLVGVGRCDLYAEPDFVLRHERVGGHRGVDAFAEQVSADLVDLIVVDERNLDDREPALVRRADVETIERVEDPMRSLPQGQAGEIDATGEGPE
jgi:hypothetical protein